uniref:G-protein coupled receptors family 1 profile domain-containing protein n=1 Tax=Romanomermis culicivorax TaxID=13658 RepID=A0A915J216_ROMCU
MSNLNDSCINLLPMWEQVMTVPILSYLIIQYAVVLYTINYSDDTDYSNPFYTLITGTGIADLGMLLFNVYGVLNDILGYQYLGSKLDSFIGFLLYWSLGWYGTQIFVLIVTTNRLVAIIYNSYYARFTVTMAKILCLSALLLSTVIVAPCYILIGFHYSTRFKVSLFLQPGESSYTFLTRFINFDEIFGYTVSVYIVVVYVILSLYLIKFYKSIISRNASYKKEVIFFVQGVCFALLLCFVNTVHWYIAPYCGALNRIGNWVFAGSNPIIYLILDGKLRHSIFRKLLRKDSTQVTPTN